MGKKRSRNFNGLTASQKASVLKALDPSRSSELRAIHKKSGAYKKWTKLNLKRGLKSHSSKRRASVKNPLRVTGCGPCKSRKFHLKKFRKSNPKKRLCIRKKKNVALAKARKMSYAKTCTGTLGQLRKEGLVFEVKK